MGKLRQQWEQEKKGIGNFLLLGELYALSDAKLKGALKSDP